MKYFKHYSVMTVWKTLCSCLSENCLLPAVGLLKMCVIWLLNLQWKGKN